MARGAARCCKSGSVDLGWICTDSLRPLFAELALLVGYQFDDRDWFAINHGVQGADSQADRWFEHPVGPIAVVLALEPAADETVFGGVYVSAESLQERIGWLTGLLRSWHLTENATERRADAPLRPLPARSATPSTPSTSAGHWRAPANISTSTTPPH
jgi:hypothetical protein